MPVSVPRAISSITSCMTDKNPAALRHPHPLYGDSIYLELRYPAALFCISRPRSCSGDWPEFSPSCMGPLALAVLCSEGLQDIRAMLVASQAFTTFQDLTGT